MHTSISRLVSIAAAGAQIISKRESPGMRAVTPRLSSRPISIDQRSISSQRRTLLVVNYFDVCNGVSFPVLSEILNIFVLCSERTVKVDYYEKNSIQNDSAYQEHKYARCIPFERRNSVSNLLFIFT